MLRRIALDRLPADLYPDFNKDRADLKATCAALGIVPDSINEIWTKAYLETERNDYWLRRRRDIARRAMNKVKKQLTEAVQHKATTPPAAVAPAAHL